MIISLLRLSLVFFVFTSIEANAKVVSAPTSDFGASFVFCSHGNNSAKFTAVIESDLKVTGEALLVSDFQPFYSSPFLNKVTYKMSPDHTIRIEHKSFSLVILPDGKGVYQRKGEVETPPTDPEPLVTANYKSPADSKLESATYFLFGPISVECWTPFTRSPVPPTGFSVGN